MLVHFPIGLLTAGLLFDAAGLALAQPSLWQVGGHLLPGGLLAGVLAAAPGIVDFFASVPKGSGAATRTLRHGVLSMLALSVFGAAWLLRGGVAVEPSPLVLGAELLGSLLLSGAGFLGGALVLEDLVGVQASPASE
jgi:uncharacterized membrane protein